MLVAHELGPLAPLVDRAVVMRDGRVVYDGAPLADAEVHAPSSATCTRTTTSSRVDRPPRHDHAPHVAAPIEPPLEPRP